MSGQVDHAESGRSLREGRACVIEQTGLEEAVRQAANPEMLMQRVADEAMTLVEGAEGVLVGFVHDGAWLTFECGSGFMKEQIGNRVPLDRSLDRARV